MRRLCGNSTAGRAVTAGTCDETNFSPGLSNLGSIERRGHEATDFAPGFARHPPTTQGADMTATVNPIPPGMHTVTPHLVCKGAAAAIEFYKEAFGAIETFRLAGPDGKLMHASLRIGDSTIMLVDEFPEMQAVGPSALGMTPVTIHLAVADADAWFARATSAPPMTLSRGEWAPMPV